VTMGGCAGVTVLEAGIGPQTAVRSNAGHVWEGSGGRVDLRLRRISESGATYCEYIHESNLATGWPFNDHYEDWEERVSCGVRMNLGRVLEGVWEASQ
ncbi:MAG: hypothetical protein ACRDL7_15020, partial [Gaiellaceae bacterium]